MKKALLVLEDGRIFEGRSFGATSESAGEVVFNTSMMGYQEVLTDPSYAGQMVCMTYPMIGNYGIAAGDFESRRVFVEALIVKEVSRIRSNWRSKYSLEDYLKSQGIPGLCDIDTRALVRHLRNRGSMRGMLVDAENAGNRQDLVRRVSEIPSMAGCDWAARVTAGHVYHWAESPVVINGQGPNPAVLPDETRLRHVVVYDLGVKRSILRQLVAVGCRVTVVPAATPASEVLAMRPEGILLSNGPGDPDPVSYASEAVKALLGKLPIFGICLGHQILGIALGARSYKLKFGHRGANHPVQDLATGKVEITSQNHGFALDIESLPRAETAVTHLNLNDQTLEGFRHTQVPAFSVQYHPEASPGPHDSNYLFRRFTNMMDDWQSQRGDDHRAMRG